METRHRVLPRGERGCGCPARLHFWGQKRNIRGRLPRGLPSGREKDRHPLRPRTGKGRRERSGSPGLPGAGASRRGVAAAQLPPGSAAGRPADRRPPGPGPRARALPPPASRSRCGSQRDEPGWHERLAVPGIDQARWDPGAPFSWAAGGRGEGGAEGARSQPAGTGREATRCCVAPRAVGGGQETGGTSQFGRDGGHPIPGKSPGPQEAAVRREESGGKNPLRGASARRRHERPPWGAAAALLRLDYLAGLLAALPRPRPPRCPGMSGRGHCGGSAFGRAAPLAQARCRFRRETARAARMRGRKWLSEGLRGPPVSERRSGVSSPSWRRLVVGKRPFSGFSTPICPGPVASRRCAPPSPTAGIPR